MIRSDGQCKVNGVLLGELKLNLLGQSAVMEAVYALCNVDNGERYGRGTRNANWSEDTLAKIAELVQLIERDIVRDVFEGGVAASSGEPTQAYTTDGVSSL